MGLFSSSRGIKTHHIQSEEKKKEESTPYKEQA